ncbi:YwpF-like family protein [Sutcliffiella deserti]|uniref:YwpF-like family protein n=1 Tax=Sutcliffiella deserti TaxID=2875501 RepID=UPI001CBF0FB3|nr:YwpF-like family protein [Sutcliffiella deserti]
MKTFKLVALSIVHDDESVEELDLQDGLIINREYGKENWLIEALLPKVKAELYEKIYENNETLHVQATISKKTNAPASFQTVIRNVSVMDEHMSILLEGELHRRTDNYSEKLLESLVHEGFQGEDLVQAFKEKINSKPLVQSK